MSNNPHIGSSLDDFLSQERAVAEVNAVASERVLAWQIEQAIVEKGLSKTEMAKAMKTSRAELDKIEPEQREEVMQIVTSWMRTGIEQGRQEGREREIELVLRMLSVKLGSLDPEIEAQIRGLEIDRLEELGIALLNFKSADDLTTWLKNFKQPS
ncbi:MAG: DUF4351 domain-containing protein [Hydrococcus sp. RU_2_2]|nr:DUF4351 domain-containing protein [Hydrococcus sp. RU_2_2]NJP19160.1 DUF4351 domain-containing protein [Hydrococcus sp. CRU_1_1]NJQ96523.1 DUF4351 domain-containing protein [Hydrococcus sp. CSU_1_8]